MPSFSPRRRLPPPATRAPLAERLWLPIVSAIAVVIVLLDLFVWRPY